MIFFPNSHSMADVSSFKGGCSLRCPKDGVFFDWIERRKPNRRLWLGKRFSVTGNGAHADTKYILRRLCAH